MKKFKKFLALVVVGLLLATPVFAEDDVLELGQSTDEITPVVKPGLYTLSNDDTEEPEATESELAELEDGSDGPVEDSPVEDSPVVDSRIINESTVRTEVVSHNLDEVLSDFSCYDNGMMMKYYKQYKYLTVDGYNVVKAYISGDDDKYKGAIFFVYDKEHNKWLRFDYSDEAASMYLRSPGKEGDLNISSVMDLPYYGGKVFQGDNPKTALDEQYVPIIIEKDVSGIDFSWRDLSEIPFVKTGGDYTYAGQKEELRGCIPKNGLAVDLKETYYDGYHIAVFDVDDVKYAVQWIPSVSYDGRAHVWTDQAKVNLAKQNPDVEVYLYRDGDRVDPKDFSVTFKNNINVKYTNGTFVSPSFKIALKGKYQKDNKKLPDHFDFDIDPIPIGSGKLQAKKVIVQGDKVTISNLYFTFDDGRKISLAKYDIGKGKGSYVAEVTEDGTIRLVGRNNFALSETELLIESPKKVTYEF